MKGRSGEWPVREAGGSSGAGVRKGAGRGGLRSGVPGQVKGRPASAGPTLSAEDALQKISPARRAAFRVLLLVGEGKGHSDELLHDSVPGSALEGLSGQDRNLTTALVMGVLRWQIALDARVRGLLARPEQQISEPVMGALRMGAFQLLHMDRIPAHAALSESVDLCRAAGEPHAAGMVNAVLRKVAAAQRPGQRLHESTAAFAERLGHPRWMVERWVAAYGREVALRVCEADQREPGQGGMFGGERGASAMGVEDGSSLAGFDPEDAELGAGMDRAGWPVMDDGSRLVAELAAAVAPAVGGRALRVWDCCAAPGGKTMVLARRLGGRAEVLATDVSPRRTEAMRRRMERYGFGRKSAYGAAVGFGVAEAAALPEAEGNFDLILCDVPCSGTGTLARNPEIRHRLRVEDLARQAERQREILRASMRRLAVGGRLVYSTCSLEPEEGEEVVASVEGMRRVDVGATLRGMVEAGVLRVRPEAMVRGGALRTFPGVQDCDGFFAVVLERV